MGSYWEHSSFAPPFVAAAGLPELVVPEGLGVNIHFTDPRAGEIEMLVEGGFRWVRMDFAWEATEREKGKYDFTAYDRLLANLEKHHLRTMLILDYANRHYDQGLSPASDEGRKAFARWAVAAARHFRGRDILWEMHNEPNIQFWKPKPDVQQYIELALEVGRALRQAEPGEQYMGRRPLASTCRFWKHASGQDFSNTGRRFRSILIGSKPRKQWPASMLGFGS